MTLRGRLATAFLAVVLGPVILGSLFVGVTVATVTRDRTVERLDHAVTTVRTAIGAVCRQLQASADAVATLPQDRRDEAAAQLVRRGLATRITTDGDGEKGWRDCAKPSDSGVGAIAAQVEIDGRVVMAAQALDAGFIDRLALSSGADVTLMAHDGAGARAVHSTLRSGSGDVPLAAEAQPRAVLPVPGTGIASGSIADGDRYVRRLAIEPGQPLPLAVSVPVADSMGLYSLLAVGVVVSTAATVVVAWWLARLTTRPLAELALAADRVASGELSTRMPVTRDDELGRMAGSFNRMTHELQSYVQALTTSRDQLRGHLAILGDTLSSTHDLHRILRVILRTAQSATGARAGLVLLVDPADDTLTARCAQGLTGLWDVAEADLPRLRIPLGVGVLGTVAATGEPQRGGPRSATAGGHPGRSPAIAVVDQPAGPPSGNPPAGPRADREPAEEPVCHSYVAVPICAPATVGDPLVPGGTTTSAGVPAVLGVLVLYDRLGSDEFDDADLLTLRTFAGQAGVAVHNVRVHEEAQRLSLTDPLTGLWNYRCLRESLRREVERASRFGRMLAVLVLDLDHFKEVNDTYGHAAGDQVLGEFARRIRIALREVDVAFRQGGEEFVVLLPETDGYGGVTVAERLGAAVREIPVPIDARRTDAAGRPVDRIPISVSIGIAVYPEHGATAQQVLDAADDALYAAKHAGRDTYRLAERVSATVVEGQSDQAATTPNGPQPPRQSRGR